MESPRTTRQLTLPFDHEPPDPYSRDAAAAGGTGLDARPDPGAAIRDPHARPESAPRFVREPPARPAREARAEVEPLPPGPALRPPHDPESIQRLVSDLRALVGTPVRLRVHDNRSTMVSFRRESSLLHLRVHHMFLGAGADVVRALAEYARARTPDAGKRLDQYVRENRVRIRPLDVELARQKPLETAGRAHDLAAIFDALNRKWFDGTIDARIGWGRGTTSRRRRSIRMGAYYHDTRTILIHPSLDRMEVPRYFVELVVYHEMLHQAVPQQRTEGGRRAIHSPEFRRRERLFHEFERARAWERRHLALLLRPPRAPRERST